ncbi:MAG: NADAR family protein [Lactobacillaceae bacterium]|jgi:ribA/ribD-fused uncharacterized protein|nr:NADAR family protein [Lactobacillaceae bacterium]
MRIIETFTLDETRFLSNFYPHKKGGGFYPHKIKVIYNDIEFDCVENAYQAAKSLDKTIQLKIKDMTPYEAKKLSEGGYEIRPDWKDVRYDIMYDLVWQKFSRHPKLKKLLLDTKDAELQEGNDWGDVYWGVCEGKGENNLGKILMKIRNNLIY